MTDIPYNPLEGERPELSINLHDSCEKMISVVVVHKDAPEYLSICLQSIANASINNNYEVIVVDNGSSGPDSETFLADLEEEEDVKVVRLKENKYWSYAANRGAAAADKNSKYFIFMHHDVVVLNPAWLDILTSVSFSQSSGLVGVSMDSYHIQQQRVDFIEEWCILMTRECWEDIGPWPEELPQIGMAFVLTVKAKNGGHNPQAMKNQMVHHYRIFNMNINEYELLTDEAMTTIPKLLKSTQAQSVSV